MALLAPACDPKMKATLRAILTIPALCLTAAMAAPPANEGAVRNGHNAKEAMLIGIWRVTSGSKMPANLQLQFAVDVYFEKLEFVPAGKLRVSARAGVIREGTLVFGLRIKGLQRFESSSCHRGAVGNRERGLGTV